MFVPGLSMAISDIHCQCLWPPRHARLGGHDVLLAKVPLQQIVRRTVGEKKLPGLWAPALSRPGEGRGARPVLKAQRLGIGGLGGVSVTV